MVAMMAKIQNGLLAYEASDYILTDDKAPVELLGMKVIDELIREEVSYYRSIYDEGGIEALLSVL